MNGRKLSLVKNWTKVYLSHPHEIVQLPRKITFKLAQAATDRASKDVHFIVLSKTVLADLFSARSEWSPQTGCWPCNLQGLLS